MSNLVRYLKKYIQKDLTKKMVFLAGPRQVGKTTFALSLLKKPDLRSKAYLNWDDVKNKIQLKNGELPINQNLIIIDEIHKFKNWRNSRRININWFRTMVVFVQ